MSKFNVTAQRTVAAGPVVTEQRPSGTTYEGAAGYARDSRSELFLLAVANMVGEDTFYESAGNRDQRYAELVAKVAVTDPTWTAGFLAWLRAEGNMRSAPLVGALEAAKAMVAAGIPGARPIVASVLQRADEPGEALAYWLSNSGRSMPKPVKRGIADGALRLYSEYPLLKYDTGSHGVRFADVIELTHPGDRKGSRQRIRGPWQGDLFEHAIDRRHSRANPTPESLAMVQANRDLRALLEEEPFAALETGALKAAGMTWEDVLSLVGSKVDKAKLWAALIPLMGYMALLRNLRNFDVAGVPDDVAFKVAERLADREQVVRSRQFPLRFLAAYRNVPSLRWGHALEKALTASLANVPELPGRSLVLVDRSGSMFGRMSKRSELTSADAAAVFGSAVALRNVGRADLVEFGTSSSSIPVKAGDSLLRTIGRFGNLGGTETAAAVRAHYRGHDRVLIVTDEQAWQGHGNPGAHLPAHVPLYTWNLVGYRRGHGAGVPNRYTFAGLTDAAFRMVPLLEAARNAAWPWEQTRR
jgi:hypothetical protein